MCEKSQSCCFFGHRKINKTEELENKLFDIIENLIINEKIDIFYFDSKSEFDTLCYETVSKFKEKYSYIRRIYLRAEYPHINDDYRMHLLNFYNKVYKLFIVFFLGM